MQVNNKETKQKFDANEIMDRLTLRFFDKNIQSHFKKNQERQLSVNRKVIKSGLFLIGCGFFIDNILIDKDILRSVQVSALLIAASICLIIFERFILRYFSLIITAVSIIIIMMDLTEEETLDGGQFVQDHLWVLYNKGILLMTHIIVAFTCVPEWYFKAAILASSTQYIFIKQFIVSYYDNYIQLQIIFLLAVVSFYFQEKREKKIYYMKQAKKKELESWKQMLDQIVPVSVFVVNREQCVVKKNSNTTTQTMSQTNIINQNMLLAASQALTPNKMNIEFINQTCLKTFEIQSKEEFEQKLRKILVKKRYTVKKEKSVNLPDKQKIETPSQRNGNQQQVMSPLFRMNPFTQNSFNRQDFSQRNIQQRKNKNDLETYSKNLFKIIEQLRHPRTMLQFLSQQNHTNNQIQVETISSKSNNNMIQLNSMHQQQNNHNIQLDITTNGELQQQPHQKISWKQHQFLNCKYIIQPNQIKRAESSDSERKILHYDIRLIEGVWNGRESIIGVITDVSEQVMAERKQEMMSYKNSVMNTITHDLKTPLNGIQLILSSTLQDNKCSRKELKESISSALIQGHLLEYRINDLLDYSKLINSQNDCENVKVNVDSFDINQSILFCLSLYKLSATKKGIKLFFNGINILEQSNDTHFPEVISQNDKQRFQQILVNLIGNSLKFTFEGSIKVQTQYISKEELEVSVLDTGIGMPQGIVTNLQDKSQNFQFETRQSEKKNMRHGNIIKQLDYFTQFYTWKIQKDYFQQIIIIQVCSYQYNQLDKLNHTKNYWPQFIVSVFNQVILQVDNFNPVSYPSNQHIKLLVYYILINLLFYIQQLGIGLGLDVSKRLIRLITREDTLSVNSEQNLGTKIAFKMLLNYEPQILQHLYHSTIKDEQKNEISSSSALIPTDKSDYVTVHYQPVPIFTPKFIEQYSYPIILKIMIVDDTSFNIIALQQFIQIILRSKCIIDVAYNGLQAVNIYKKRLVDQKKKVPFEQIQFQEIDLNNKCDISELENSFVSENGINDNNLSSEIASQALERSRKFQTIGKKENLNQRSPYDIIFMDINMPIMDGYQAISKIRTLERNCNMEYQTFIAVVTAFGEECDRYESLNIGANYHITKPLKQDLIKQILYNCKSSQLQYKL